MVYEVEQFQGRRKFTVRLLLYIADNIGITGTEVSLARTEEILSIREHLPGLRFYTYIKLITNRI